MLGLLHYRYNSPHTKHKVLEQIRRHHVIPYRLSPAYLLHRYHIMTKHHSGCGAGHAATISTAVRA